MVGENKAGIAADHNMNVQYKYLICVTYHGNVLLYVRS